MTRWLFWLLLWWWPVGILAVAPAEELRIVTTEEPPTNYVLKGELVGTTTDIVKEILNHLGIRARIDVLPWARAFDYAKTRSNVVIFTAGRTQRRLDHGFLFIGPVVTRKHTLYKKRGAPISVNGPEEIVLQKLVVGAMLGDWRGFYFKDRGVVVEEVPFHKLNAEKLIRGRCDLWALSDLELPLVLKKTQFHPDEVEVAYVFKEAPSYIMFSKGTPRERVERWGRALDEISETGFFKETAVKWSRILNVTMGYEREKGFFMVE